MLQQLAKHTALYIVLAHPRLLLHAASVDGLGDALCSSRLCSGLLLLSSAVENDA